jgi:putative endonuclease
MIKDNHTNIPMAPKDRGRWGETLAAEYVETLGYAVIERNWRHQKFEIDLIARLDDHWVFVEVKTRKTGYLESALEAVDLGKQQRIIQAAHQFIRRQKKPQKSIRFDILCVEYDATTWRIQHIPDAFISLP